MFILTHRAKRGLLNDRQRTIVNGQMSYVDSEEHEALQLGQVVVPQLEVEDDDGGLPLQHRHGFADVLKVGELTEDVQTVLLGRASAGLQLASGRADLAVLGICEGGVDAHRDDGPQVADHAECCTMRSSF